MNGEGETYHIHDKIVSIRELVELICQKMDVSFEGCVEVVGERLGKDAAYMLNSDLVRQKLGWTDKISLEDGVMQCIDWVDQNIDELKKQSLDYVHKP